MYATHQAAPEKAPTLNCAVVFGCGEANTQSMAKALRPIDPNGTKTDFHLPSGQSFAQAMSRCRHPRKTSPASSVTTDPAPCSTVLQYKGSWTSTSAPKNQNHDNPNTDRNTGRDSRAARILSRLDTHRFQSSRC